MFTRVVFISIIGVEDGVNNSHGLAISNAKKLKNH